LGKVARAVSGGSSSSAPSALSSGSNSPEPRIKLLSSKGREFHADDDLVGGQYSLKFLSRANVFQIPNVSPLRALLQRAGESVRKIPSELQQSVLKKRSEAST
jgi:hypothetical protein